MAYIVWTRQLESSSPSTLSSSPSPHFVSTHSSTDNMNWEKISKRIIIPENITACWTWVGQRAGSGVHEYGRAQINGKSVAIHRVVYEIFVGKIPPKMVIDHLCRNHLCVNPSHLEAVTSRDNTMRGNGIAAKNARKKVCKYGHRMIGKNVRMINSGRHRQCVTCRKRIDRQK